MFISPCEERDGRHPHLYRGDAGVGAARHLLHPPGQHPGPPRLPHPALPRQADRADPRHQVAAGRPQGAVQYIVIVHGQVPGAGAGARDGAGGDDRHPHPAHQLARDVRAAQPSP